MGILGMEGVDFLENETVARYRKENQQVQKGAIVFTGSSLMEQFPIVRLWADKQLAGVVYNRGVSGFVTQEFLQVLDPLIFDLAPQTLVINIGTNDLNDPHYEQTNLLKRMAEIFTALKRELSSCRVIFLALYPVNEKKMLAVGEKEPWLKEASTTRNNHNLKAANQAIASLCQKFAFDFVDVNACLIDEFGQLKANYTVDGIHLYPEIYALILEALLKKIDFGG